MKTKNLFLFVAVLCLCWGSQSWGQTVITEPGTVINKSGEYVLVSDLNCNRVHLTITANNVTFDGRGHTIIVNNERGIVLNNVSNVEIKNIVITNCDQNDGNAEDAILLFFSNHNVIKNITTNNNFHGICLDHSDNNEISNNTFNAKYDGIFSYDADSNKFFHNNGSISSSHGHGIVMTILNHISRYNYGCGNNITSALGDVDIQSNGNDVENSESVIELGHGGIEKIYSLSQNYPNPFNPETTISFSLPKSEFVTLDVYNLLGKKVKTLIRNKKMLPGNHSVNFNGSEFPTGTYIYKIQAGDFVETKKMTLLK